MLNTKYTAYNASWGKFIGAIFAAGVMSDISDKIKVKGDNCGKALGCLTIGGYYLHNLYVL